MKNLTLTIFAALAILAIGCNGGSSADSYVFPKAGTVIDTASMPITNDNLNDFNFELTITADSNISKGIYDIRAAYGPSVAEGSFTMPKGAERYKPIIKKGTEPYTYIIGFRVPKDTAFYDYFEVAGKKTSIGMKYLKAYTFD